MLSRFILCPPIIGRDIVLCNCSMKSTVKAEEDEELRPLLPPLALISCKISDKEKT